MQQLNLSQTYKKTYKEPLFLAFNFDISDTTVFTL